MSTFTAVLDNSRTNVEGHSKFLNRLFAPGVPLALDATSLQVTQRGAGANMSVDVAKGDAHLQLPSTDYSFWSWTDAVTNVTVSAADPTNPRIDVVVAWCDTTVTTTLSNNSPGSFKFSVMAGTPAGSPVEMADATIQSTLGATVAWTKLATISVLAASTTVTDSVITDRRTDVESLGYIDSSSIVSDWKTASTSVTSVIDNGGGNYGLTVSSDNSTTISEGMRLRTTRTVVAPTQCATFDGVNDYYSDTTPSGMTFTDDAVVGGYIKPSSYSAGAIISRFNGTSGFRLGMLATGQIEFVGWNAGSGNYRQLISYQSVPLNKWSHIALQFDLSSAPTTSATTNYIMIDGEDVPCYMATAGTNPTAIVQAGDLQIGASNGGVFFPGKLAQIFASSAKITQTNVRVIRNQGLTPALISAHNIVSAYSFDNSTTDLNTTNANNLTANGGVLSTTADSPFGGQAGGTISSTLDYGVATKVDASTINVKVAEGCTVPTSGGVSALSYSTYKSPYGFPAWGGTNSLGNIKRCFDFSTGSAGDVDIEGMTMTVTIPDGGAMVRATGKAPNIESGGGAGTRLYLLMKLDGTTVSTAQVRQSASNYPVHADVLFEGFVTAGAHTFKLTASSSASGVYIQSNTGAPITLKVTLSES